MSTTDTREQWRLALEAEYEARLGVWSDMQGHLAFLHDQVVGRRQPNVVELGVRSGMSTAALLWAVEQADGHLWSVDLQPPQVPSWWQLTGRWTFVQGDDLATATIAALFPEALGWLDLLLLDTSHDYTHTLAELRIYAPRVNPGGLVCCHDTELEQPEQVGPQPPYPVAKALDAYCLEAGLSWSNRDGSYGMGVIQVPK